MPCVQQAKIPAVLDAPQLFESGADALCAYTLAVTAPEDTRLARIMERDGIDRAAARLRMRRNRRRTFTPRNAHSPSPMTAEI